MDYETGRHYLFHGFALAVGQISVVDCTDSLGNLAFFAGAAMLSATVSNES
jgi:hypothetical protein